MWKQITATAALVGLTACGGEAVLVPSDDQTSSYFGTAGTFGGVPGATILSSNSFQGGSSSVGYGWIVGEGFVGGFEGAAGLQSTPAAIGSTPTGVATYSGSYELGAIENIQLVGGQLTNQSRRRFGSINLIVNPFSGTITGSGTDLSVNGTMSGTDIGGSVTYLGPFGNTTGQLDGRVGSQAAIGAFHGNDSDTVFAGGFNVSR